MRRSWWIVDVVHSCDTGSSTSTTRHELHDAHASIGRRWGPGRAPAVGSGTARGGHHADRAVGHDDIPSGRSCGICLCHHGGIQGVNTAGVAFCHTVSATKYGNLSGRLHAPYPSPLYPFIPLPPLLNTTHPSCILVSPQGGTTHRALGTEQGQQPPPGACTYPAVGRSAAARVVWAGWDGSGLCLQVGGFCKVPAMSGWLHWCCAMLCAWWVVRDEPLAPWGLH